MRPSLLASDLIACYHDRKRKQSDSAVDVDDAASVGADDHPERTLEDAACRDRIEVAPQHPVLILTHGCLSRMPRRYGRR